MALNGNLTGSSHFFSEGLFYNDIATSSVRINDEAAEALTFTPSSASNLTTWTWSGWVKRGTLGTQRSIFAAQASSEFSLFFHSNDTLRVWTQGGNGAIYTTQLFRDVSAWYHIVLKSSTSSPFYNLYVNGSEITSFTYDNRANYPATNNAEVNTAAVHRIGADTMSGNLLRLGGYIAEVNFIDGTALAPASFGETKNGVWIPIDTSGLTFGTNGYRLRFLQTGTSANSSGIGADTSGEDNHWAVANLAASDVVLDSPEINFSTLNPLKPAHGTFTEGNLKVATGTNANVPHSTFEIPQTGKWYWEIGVVAVGEVLHGVVDALTGTQTRHYRSGNEDISIQGGSVVTTGDAFVNGDVLSVAIDMDNDTIDFKVNNTSVGDGDFDLDGNQTNLVVFCQQGSGSGSATLIFNFGQDSSFVGTETAQGNKDRNGIGDFYYAPPSGFLALCTANLPESTIGPSSTTQADDHFNTALFTGGSGDVAVSGVGFQPDWVWMKSRNNAQNHSVGDSSRGGTKLLSTSRTVPDQTIDELHFTSDGFTSNTDWHTNNYTYVAWNWKANGGTTVTNDASATSIGSIDSVIQANTTSGFSIVTYTSPGSGVYTVAHGLSQAPDLIISHSRGAASAWWVFLTLLDGTVDYVNLSGTEAKANDSASLSVPTSTVFSMVNNYMPVNQPTISYCFHSVEGYSKIGKYTGNGNADGTFVFTGFKPAWVMIKRTNGTGSWNIADSKRSPNNVVAEQVQANLNNAESTAFSFDFLSNGFKARTTDAARNGDGDTYIYMAFAEAPFKYANAR